MPLFCSARANNIQLGPWQRGCTQCASGAIICTSRFIPTRSTGAWSRGLPLPRGVFYCPFVPRTHAAFSTTLKRKGIKRAKFLFYGCKFSSLGFLRRTADLIIRIREQLCTSLRRLFIPKKGISWFMTSLQYIHICSCSLFHLSPKKK
jgi:hypothetical protein